MRLNNKSLFILAAFVFVLSICSYAGEQAKFIERLEKGEKVTIVTMGTSLSAGNRNWPRLMKEWLDKEYPGLVTLHNLAVGASASERFLKGRSGMDVLPRAVNVKPDAVFIEFAVNDAYLPYKISVECSKKNLKAMIDGFSTNSPQPEIILQTMNSVTDMPAGKHSSNRPDIEKYYQGYRDVAKEKGLLLIDHYPNWKKLMDTDRAGFLKLVPDGIHPGLPGYRKVLMLELKKRLKGVKLNKTGYALPAMPEFRVVPKGFQASEADIRAVCKSAGRALWKHFPEYKIEPFVVTHGKSGPIINFKRNEKGEIVIRLHTGKTFWCQYAYQFSHEFCHLLCKYDEDDPANEWFEETICETASLFAIRAMSRSWKKDPPYKNWSDFRDALRNYSDDIIRENKEVHEVYRVGVAGFYKAHKDALQKNAANRPLNRAMAIVLLKMFEEEPARWGAVRWLNSSKSPKGESFTQYLQKWHDAVPEKHKSFIVDISDLFEINLLSA